MKAVFGVIIFLAVAGCVSKTSSSATDGFSVHATEKQNTDAKVAPRLWLEKVPNEYIYEYLLPDEIDGITDTLSPELQKPLLQKFEYAIRNYDNCRYSSQQLGKFLTSNIPPKQLLDLKDYISYVLFFRKLGIPATIDFFPATTRKNPYHHWFYFPDPCFLPIAPQLMQSCRNGKVYRKTGVAQSIPQAGSQEYIPPFFRNPFQKDVTNEYLNTLDLSLDFPQNPKVNNAYLALFNDSAWLPVVWSKIQNGKCHFTHLGRENIYLPVCYPDSVPMIWGEPFLLKSSGECHFFNGADSTIRVRVDHFAPTSRSDYSLNSLFFNGYFESANDKNFSEITHFYLAHTPLYRWGEISVTPSSPQRYWRHCINRNLPLSLAELQFINSSGELVPATYFSSRPQDFKGLCDGNPETFAKYTGWIGVDFGRPVAIAKIRYLLPLKNRIQLQHSYELFYFQQGKWLSAGIQRAEEIEIVFTDVPANRLYRLQDLTTSEFTPIFTVENQNVRFR